MQKTLTTVVAILLGCYAMPGNAMLLPIIESTVIDTTPGAIMAPVLGIFTVTIIGTDGHIVVSRDAVAFTREEQDLIIFYSGECYQAKADAKGLVDPFIMYQCMMEVIQKSVNDNHLLTNAQVMLLSGPAVQGAKEAPDTESPASKEKVPDQHPVSLFLI